MILIVKYCKVTKEKRLCLSTVRIATDSTRDIFNQICFGHWFSITQVMLRNIPTFV